MCLQKQSFRISLRNTTFSVTFLVAGIILMQQVPMFFVLEQNGSELFLQEYDGYGNNVGNGSGVIQGKKVFLNWVEPYLFVMSLEIKAELTIGSQGNILSGNMYAEDNMAPITLYRQ